MEPESPGFLPRDWGSPSLYLNDSQFWAGLLICSVSKTGAMRALLAHPNGEHLDYVGAAFIALRDDVRREFLSEVERLATTKAGFGFARLYDVRWCKPRLTVRVKHLAASKTLRHATVRAITLD